MLYEEIKDAKKMFFTLKHNSLIPEWWIDNNSSGLVEVCVDQPLPVPPI